MKRRTATYPRSLRVNQVLRQVIAEEIERLADADERLRRAYVVALTLREGDHPRVVQAWFTGLNPELDDRAPIRLLAEGTENEARAVLGAARAFRAGG